MLGVRRSLSVLAIALGLVALAATPPAGAAARTTYKTNIVMKSQWPYHVGWDTYKVPGLVRSKRAVCERNRRVKVVVPGTTRRTKTNKAGRWSVRVPGGTVRIGGTYKAIAVKKVVRKKGTTIVCKRDVAVIVRSGG